MITENRNNLNQCELAGHWKRSWKEHRTKLDIVNDKIEELQELYDVNEVAGIFNHEFGDSDDHDIVAQMIAVDITGNILRKRYDLETAQFIGSYRPNLSQNDDCYYEERLYQQDTGEFFLIGHGGRNTKYSRICEFEDEPIRGGRRIFSISISEAQEWIAEHLDC